MNQEDMEFMDIDGPEFLNDVNNQIANIRATSRYDQIDNTNTAMFEQFDQQTPSFAEIAVLDTNFLLSKLGFLDALLDIANKYPGSLLVLLPWVVIRELDGLKGSRNDTDVCASARKAMRFLELRLRDKMAGNAKGDDRILDCCMYFQQATQRKVTLLSNDRNLLMVHDIDSISAESTHKMEALLNRIAGKRDTTLASKYSHTIQHHKPHYYPPEIPANTMEDHGMDIDDVCHEPTMNSYTQIDHYSMMIDDEFTHMSDSFGTQYSKWAKAQHTRHRHNQEPPAYLDNDPTLIAPKRPYRPEHGVYKTSYAPIYSPR
ncbi:hypothetical protein CU098_011399 [Rhizopus stolonifer]|uniref:PIN domain-containing protein n=1 Tax=Rhizopus stolonifer TaxID=4846 RepID=A0A367KXB2_RHIST|nr:hypothetical protein CU098_011399 [Rhizopus stolonifer]